MNGAKYNLYFSMIGKENRIRIQKRSNCYLFLIIDAQWKNKYSKHHANIT